MPSVRDGKVARVDQWLADAGLDWHAVETTFYSDSLGDLPLLEKVDHPVATNPDDAPAGPALTSAAGACSTCSKKSESPVLLQ